MYLSRLLIVLLFPLTMVIAFQNCSTSSFEQPDPAFSEADSDNDSSGGVLQGPDGLVALNLNNGDSVTYLKSGNVAPAAQQRVVMAKANGRILMTTETQAAPADGNTAPELPQFYCQNSTLPHCRHLSQLECKSTHCDTSGIPVVCAEDIHISGSALTDLFGKLSGIETQEKKSQTGEASLADCDSPNVSFSKVGEAPVIVSLAQRQCVQEGRLYGTANFEPLQTDMEGRISNVQAQSTSCNQFYRYRWKETAFTYAATSGNIPAPSNYMHEVVYKGDQRADLKFKNAGSNATLCATDILLNESEIRAFFPEGGLRYDVLKTNLVELADASTAQITFTDTSYGSGGEAKFFLNRNSAETYNGGAILDPVHENAIKAAVAQLNQRVSDGGVATACP